MGLRLTRLKPLFWGPSDIIDPATARTSQRLADRLGFDPRFVVLFNYSPTPTEHHGFMDWINENIGGKAYSMNREHLGATGEVFFENEEDALLFFLHYS